MDNTNRRGIPPHRPPVGEKKMRLRRPGTTNLNRMVKGIRCVESASLVLQTHPFEDSLELEQKEASRSRKNHNEQQHRSNFSGLSDSSETEDDDEPSRQNMSKNKKNGRFGFSPAKIPTGRSELRTKIGICKSKSKGMIYTDKLKLKFQQSHEEIEPGLENLPLPPIEGHSTHIFGSTRSTSGSSASASAEDYQYDNFNWDNLTDISEADITVDSSDEDEPGASKNECRVQVSNSIYFRKDEKITNSFISSIKIQNISKYYITFCVKTSTPEIFVIEPSIDFIKPGRSTIVWVKTNPEYEFKFSDIVQETFKIFATPIYSSHQVHSKLESLWGVYGTKLFPLIAAEEHKINFVYQISSSASALDHILENNWGNHKKIMMMNDPHDEQEFYNSWPIEDDDEHNFMMSRNQMHGWKCYCQKIGQEERFKWKKRHFLFLIFCSLVICGFFSPYYPPKDWFPPKEFIFTNFQTQEKNIEMTSKSSLEFFSYFFTLLFSQLSTNSE